MDPLKQRQPKKPSSINNLSTLPQALSMQQDNKKVCVQICPRDPNATECKCSCN